MHLQDFVSLKIGQAETLTLIISELSFWRYKLLKNYGRWDVIKIEGKHIVYLRTTFKTEAIFPLGRVVIKGRDI